MGTIQTVEPIFVIQSTQKYLYILMLPVRQQDAGMNMGNKETLHRDRATHLKD